jgi:uncharacterized protein YndB with AHSA1/START domain
MSYDLTVERLIDASPQEVFTAFTDPEAQRQWYQDHPGSMVEVDGEFRVGGTCRITFGASPDQLYTETLTYHEVERPNRLVYTELFTTPGGESWETRVTVTFEAKDGKTLLTVEQTGFPRAEIRDGHQNGWPGFLERLERVVLAKA